MRRAATWWAGLAMAILSPALWGQEPPVKICLGEGNEWAPFTYWERKDGVPDTRRLTGSATTQVLEALKRLGLSYKIRYLPWARVQQELADYRQNGLCELTWDASYKPERAEYAFYSVPLYYTHLGFFYLKRRFPEAPDLQTVNRSRVCGVIGYNYAPYGLALEPRWVEIVGERLARVTRPQKLTKGRGNAGGLGSLSHRGHPMSDTVRQLAEVVESDGIRLSRLGGVDVDVRVIVKLPPFDLGRCNRLHGFTRPEPAVAACESVANTGCGAGDKTCIEGGFFHS